MMEMREYGFNHRVKEFISYPAGQVIFEEGQAGSEMYVVMDGEVLISVEGASMVSLGRGSIFGEMALVDDQPRSATATAVVDSVLLPVDLDQFLKLIQESPDFAVETMSVMSQRMREFIEDEVQRQRLEEELEIGRRIQLSLLPDRCPEIPGWDVAATYRSARQVGGDLYDFITVPDNSQRIHFVIADVTGKGVPAALFMASARMAVRAESLNGCSPGETLRRVNRLLSHDQRSPLFLGAIYATLDNPSGKLTYANGGMERPLWLRGETGQIETLSAKGVLLGAFEEIPLEEQELDIAPGDNLVFFTDGLTEARDKEGHFFGEERLLETMAARRWEEADQLLQAIVEAVDEFAGPTPASDDLTLVVIRRRVK
jgi:serine phosphatase RsbU (regulator of sigma subunit)